MQEKIDSLYENAKNEISGLSSSKELADVKVKYLGKTGEITSLLKGMKDIPPEKKSRFRQTREYAERTRFRSFGGKGNRT